MTIQHRIAAIALLSAAPLLQAQEPAPPTFEQAAASAEERLQRSVAELSALRDQIAAEQVPQSRRLSELEGELARLREQYQQTARTLDSRTLDLANLQTEIGRLREEGRYLSGLLGEYQRNLESRLHIAELQRYAEPIERARLAPEDGNLSEQDVYRIQLALVDVALERLHEALGGARFEGTAVDQAGLVHPGTFVSVGPATLFRSSDGLTCGTAEQRLGSLEPAVIGFQDPADAAAVAQLAVSGSGQFTFDPTQGNAHKIEATQETLWEHVHKGGPVMVPIFALAGAALLVALVKWLGLTLVRRPSKKQVRALLAAAAQNDREAALQAARSMGGPGGKMLLAGAEHLDEPRELIEEVMYETVLTSRLRLQRWLPFIAITSSSAPLLGLLGTVTGIMNTFTLMTVFGTGDVKTLSSGISEALITTEYGLYVAIPSLLLYALLSRKARSIIDHMEKDAVALLNQIGKSARRQDGAAAGSSERPGAPLRSAPDVVIIPAAPQPVA